MDAIERNAAALQQLVNDLLDVSRVVTGKLRLDVQPVALPEVVAAAIDAIRPAADAKEISVVTTVGGVGPRGLGRRRPPAAGGLEPAVERGAVHAGRADASTSRSSARRNRRRGSSCATRVPAIPPDFLPHVFERFRQGVSGLTRAHGGLGLGLAIVRHLVELHGGTVTVDNNASGTGATFHRRAAGAAGARRTAPERAAVPGWLAPAGRVPAGLDGVGVLVDR